MARLLNVEDYRAAARRRLPRGLFHYVDGGADDEITLRANRRAFEEVALIPRNAVWVDKPDLSVELFGRRLSMPVLTAPCGGMRLVHPDGDCGVARGAVSAGIVPIVASYGGYSLEQVAAAVTGPKWFQLYTFGDRRIMESLVARAAAAKYEALVCSIDTAVVGNREKDFRNGFTYNMRVNLRNAVRLGPQLVTKPAWVWRFCRDGMPFDFPNTVLCDSTADARSISEISHGGSASLSPTWADLAWIRENWTGPLIVKGVLSGEDAKRAADVGADGVVVSNHGGRQLDGSPSSLSALKDVVGSVRGQLEILVDGGVRRGSDVVRAVSLGASAVLIGRPAVWGLAVRGGDGVGAVLELLRLELSRTLQLLGRESMRDLEGGVAGQL